MSEDLSTYFFWDGLIAVGQENYSNGVSALEGQDIDAALACMEDLERQVAYSFRLRHPFEGVPDSISEWFWERFFALAATEEAFDSDPILLDCASVVNFPNLELAIEITRKYSS